jgi:Mn-dependent DtxR family transcriptional regulator
MNTSTFKTFNRPSNSRFKSDTGLDVEYIKGLTPEEVIEVYMFFTQTEAGKKVAENAFKKNRRLQTSNRRLGSEKQEIINYADQQITIIKNESDKKLINIMKAIKVVVTKPVLKVRKQDLLDILELVKISLWS